MGSLAHGFLRLRCVDCAHEKLVAFSRKRRGFCAACGARRMAETAAHLVDHVIPRVPVRQWVPSFPIPLRLLFASHPRLLAPLPYDPKSKDHRRMLSHVKGEERLYGTTRIYVKTQSKQGMEGTLEWTDVYVQQGKATPRNVSNCDGVSCGQPSLSADGKALVYVRARGTP